MLNLNRAVISTFEDGRPGLRPGQRVELSGPHNLLDLRPPRGGGGDNTFFSAVGSQAAGSSASAAFCSERFLADSRRGGPARWQKAMGNESPETDAVRRPLRPPEPPVFVLPRTAEEADQAHAENAAAMLLASLPAVDTKAGSMVSGRRTLAAMRQRSSAQGGSSTLRALAEAAAVPADADAPYASAVQSRSTSPAFPGLAPLREGLARMR
eukprot:TRINITY_DN44662_c0_g1_i1.p1 TRINITY_DN44662_c0_g1~~TRINITY_DN44662_c0_g1_i1.p1  ORF type:complete len:211 (-),score=37.46 TRINITY_DN44662_c0_g1_i1:160-792(-)